MVRVIGWYVTAKMVTTRRGEPMEFLSSEDTTALYEATFFPRTYARFCCMMTTVRPYVLTGRVEEDLGAVSLNVSDIRFLDFRGQSRYGSGEVRDRGPDDVQSHSSRPEARRRAGQLNHGSADR